MVFGCIEKRGPRLKLDYEYAFSDPLPVSALALYGGRRGGLHGSPPPRFRRVYGVGENIGDVAKDVGISRFKLGRLLKVYSESLREAA